MITEISNSSQNRILRQRDAGRKQTGWYRYLMLVLLLLCHSALYAKVYPACVGEVHTFSIVPQPGYTYTWSVVPSTNATIISSTNTTVAIQWVSNTPASAVVTATGTKPGSPTITLPRSISISAQPNPQITSDVVVGCQNLNPPKERRPKDPEPIDENSCMKVCHMSSANYSVTNGQPGSTFEWTVAGGVFFSATTGPTVSIYWTDLGFGSIKVKETTPGGCIKEKTICTQVIERPDAMFTINNNFTAPYRGCRDVGCIRQPIQFTDNSVTSANFPPSSSASPIVSWFWDFGDGTTSSQQNPQHTYNTPGTYSVVLTVTNQCGCKASVGACVNIGESDVIPQISCPSLVCEGSVGHYTLGINCNSVVWTVNGGTILSPTTGSAVDVLWNNPPASGFGTITADVSGCGDKPCTDLVSATVPIIQQVGTIQGRTTVCVGKVYKYQLPKWPATNFTWTVTSGTAAIVSNNKNSHEVDVWAPGAPSSFTLHCDYVNTMVTCPDSVGHADIVVNAVPTIEIKAPEQACTGTPTTIHLATLSGTPTGTTNYTFVRPNGSIITPVVGTGASVNWTFDMPGKWTIMATNPNYCDPEPVSVLVTDPPAPVTSVTGVTEVCMNNLYAYEIITPLPNTICNWTITGGTITNGTSATTGTGNSVTITWNTAGTKTLTVTRSWADLPGCTSAPLTVNMTNAVSTVAISGNAAPCANSVQQYSAALVGGSLPPDNIQWSLSDASLGSISAGQNTMGVTVIWNNISTATANCNLIATVTKCGANTTVSYPVTIYSTPSITITPPPSICSGVPVTLTATTIPAGGNVTWNFGNGTAPATGNSVSTTYNNTGSGSQNFTITASVTGCGFTNQTTATIAVKPQPNINISPASYIIMACPPIDVPMVLSTNATDVITWSYNGTPVSPQPVPLTHYTATQTGSYQVAVTNGFGCRSTDTRIVSDLNCVDCTLPAQAGAQSQSHVLNSCGDGIVKATVSFGNVYGNYIPVPPNPVPLPANSSNILSLSISGSNNFCTVPPLVNPAATFPNFVVSNITITKPGIYPVSLDLGYQNINDPGRICPKNVTENVIVPVIADFDYNTVCNGTNNGHLLHLNDQSPILAGYAPVAAQTSWTVNGVAVSSPVDLNNYQVGAILQIVRTVTVTGPEGTYACTRTRNYTVPSVPKTKLLITTTDPTEPNSSCALREVNCTSILYAGVSKWTWSFGDGTSFISTTSPQATRTYSNDATNFPGSATTVPRTITLTVNDDYGCSFTVSRAIKLLKNTLAPAGKFAYSPIDELLCEGATSKITMSVIGGNPAYDYAWYKDDAAMNIPSNNEIYVTQSGQYWARVTDKRGCQKDFNPRPAKRTFQPLPDVTIKGEQDYCFGTPVLLNAANGTTSVTYNWDRRMVSPVVTGWSSVGNTAIITDGVAPSLLDPGVYEYQLTASQPLAGGLPCAAVSPAYTVTVHQIPDTPKLEPLVAENCDDYSIRLAVGNVQSSLTYNWSNGATGDNTIVNHGGPYRVWATDQWGCKSHATVNVPMEPSFYFWRFPSGCYEFNCSNLPKRVDGPDGVSFDDWIWMINGGGLPNPNGSWAGSGNGSTVDPLHIQQAPGMGDGNGSGTYQWLLNNGLCKQLSHPMHIELKGGTCCSFNMNAGNLPCRGDGSYDVMFTLNNTSTCQNTAYTVYATDPYNPGAFIGSVSPATGTIAPGMQTIIVNFTPVPGQPHVVFKIELNCNGNICTGETGLMEVMHHCYLNKSAPKDAGTSAGKAPLVTIAPNPANTQTRISYNIPDWHADDRYEIAVYNLLSQPITRHTVTEGKGSWQYATDQLAPGTYMVRLVKDGKALETLRMVIVH